MNYVEGGTTRVWCRLGGNRHQEELISREHPLSSGERDPAAWLPRTQTCLLSTSVTRLPFKGEGIKRPCIWGRRGVKAARSTQTCASHSGPDLRGPEPTAGPRVPSPWAPLLPPAPHSPPHSFLNQTHSGAAKALAHVRMLASKQGQWPLWVEICLQGLLVQPPPNSATSLLPSLALLPAPGDPNA